jgi:MOSC domain-containing protein YiiM
VRFLDFSFRFDKWFEDLPSSPRERGSVRRCVLRPSPGERRTPEAIELRPGQGAVGDGWNDQHESTENEISLINVHVIESLAGDSARTALSGDNLQVDLDLSEQNLPVGTRLTIGDAVLIVSPQPHRPCAQFADRFSPTAAKRVARANRRGLRGRGVLCTIERGGTIRIGDQISVERP